MHIQHHGQRARRPAVAVRITPHGQRQITHQMEAVPRPEDERVHRRQGQALQIAAVGEEKVDLSVVRSHGAIVQIVPHRPIVLEVRDNPTRVVERAAHDVELAALQTLEKCEVLADALIKNLPLDAFVVHGDRLHVLFSRVLKDPIDVRTAVLSEHFLISRRQIQLR